MTNLNNMNNINFENVCNVLVSLVESTCMQIRAEEQEDDDKKGISLIGTKSISTKHEPQEIVLTPEAIKNQFLPNHDFPTAVGVPPRIRHSKESPITKNDF